jgi:hypothetical protein
LLDLLNVLTLLVGMEQGQAKLLAQICEGALVSEAELLAKSAVGATATEDDASKGKDKKQPELF